MTVPTQVPSYTQLPGNGTGTVFAFPFKCFAVTDVLVGFIVNGLYAAQTSGFTIGSVDVNGGGTVTFTTPPPIGTLVDIRTVTPLIQPSEFANLGAFLPEVHTDTFDRVVRALQDVYRRTYTFGIHGPDTEATPWPSLPGPPQRASTILGFDPSGFLTLLQTLPAGTLSQASIGQFLYPPTNAENAAGITPTAQFYPPYDLRRYGADSTGATASDTAMASAIAVCGTAGGTIRMPNGIYTFANPLSLLNKTSIILQGDGSATGGATPATQLLFTGTVGPLIDMRSATGCLIRDCQIAHTNPAFTSTYIKCGNDGVHSDPSFCGLVNVVMGAAVNGLGNLHLDLDKCTLFTATNCSFIYGNPSVRGQATAGSSYSNVIRFRDCQWAACYVAPVQNGGEAWSFHGCTFEGLTGVNAAAGALLSANANTYFNGLVVEGCWFGDTGTGTGAWFDLYTQAAVIQGNYISGGTGTTGIVLRGSFGVSILSNTFSGIAGPPGNLGIGINLLTATSNDIVFKGNIANSVNSGWMNGNNAPTGGIDWGPNFGFTSPGTNHGAQNTTNGFNVHPDGTVDQDGLFSATTAGGTVSFSAPNINFPNACRNVQATLSGVGALTNTIYVSNFTPSGFTYQIGGAFTNPTTFYWRAKGT